MATLLMYLAVVVVLLLCGFIAAYCRRETTQELVLSPQALVPIHAVDASRPGHKQGDIKPIEVTDINDLKVKLTQAGDKMVVVGFFSKEIPMCRGKHRVEPGLDKITRELKDSIVVLKVDMDKTKDITHKYDIYFPCSFAFFKRGKLLQRIYDCNVLEMRQYIKSNLAESSVV